ncbi:MAG: hypothetical protein ABIJ45_03975, partial [Candidatus Zixiibacteriota bacterium]
GVRLENMERDWSLFLELDKDSRKAISEAVIENSAYNIYRLLHYYDGQFEDYIKDDENSDKKVRIMTS